MPSFSSRRIRASHGWLIAHLASLAAILVVLVYAGRGNWFFYDEWDFLAERAEWSLLAAHNGHLSLFPQLITTLTKMVVGLHSYWPYLAFTFAAHLLVVHMTWRVMMRAGGQPMIALLGAAVFGVLASGADNTLWAFQVGFITPVATGLAALLLAMREDLRTRDLVGITMLLLVGIGFSGTALPVTVAVVLFVCARHGWRAAAIPAAAFAVLYGAWYFFFGRGPDGGESMRVASFHDLFVRVPEYIAHAFVDSIGKMIPLAAFAPAALLFLILWVIIDLRRGDLRRVSVVHYLLLAALGFAALTALTRVGLGTDTASVGRYVYIYGALLAPAVVIGLSQVIGRSRIALTVVSALIVVIGVYNVGGLVAAGRAQAELEQTVNRAISAALVVDDERGSELADRRPSTIVAPTLTMNDIWSFVDRGEFSAVPFTKDDELDVRINLLLSATTVEGGQPDEGACAPTDADGLITVDPRQDLVYATIGGNVAVAAASLGAQSSFAQIALSPGRNELGDIGSSVVVRLPADAAGGLCVFVKN